MEVKRERGFGDWVSRGVSYTWSDGKVAAPKACDRRIIVATIDARLAALDSQSGELCPGFGNRGVVDLVAGLRNKQSYGDEYEQTSPPAIIGDLIVVARPSRTTIPTWRHRRSARLRRAQRRIALDLVSRAAGPRRSRLRDLERFRRHSHGGANTWSVIAADPKRGLVFLPTTSPATDYYGGTRLGDNRYANSVVALHAATGKIAWHFQTVHHDLWTTTTPRRRR
jgi:quinoprotein glucose dehydrogenase